MAKRLYGEEDTTSDSNSELEDSEQTKEDKDDGSEDGSNDSLDDGNANNNNHKLRKPSASRIILEVDSLKKAVEETSKCPDCQGSLELQIKTVCLASNIRLSFKDPKCSYILHSSSPSPTALHAADSDGFKRMTDYAINVLYVLGFIACGDGGTEAARLLGFLGLTNDTTMETRSFTIIEDRISPLVLELMDEILLENITEEVRLTMSTANGRLINNDFDLWRQSVAGNNNNAIHSVGSPCIT